ncbi:MAG: amino acid adenylation protein [Bacteroidetes bacterium]|jgi:amino acid adenylation domain-containing protein|nr:amino acid adenylation protein [Bacteroidota bacterium]
MEGASGKLRLLTAQRKLWLLMKDNSVFHLSCEFDINGNLNEEKWRSAIQNLVEIHQIFKTAFKPLDHSVFPDLHQLSEFDWSLVQDANTKSVFNYHLQKKSPGVYTCRIEASALVCDAYSLQFIINDLLALYNTGKPIAPDAVSFIKYAEWQQNLLNFPEHEASEFWSSYYSGETKHYFPLASSDTVGVYEPVCCEDSVNGNELDLLQKTALLLNTSVEQVLFTAFNVFAFKHGGEEQVLTGKVFNKREYEDLNSTVGPFSKTLPVKLRMNNELSFADAVREADETERDLEMWRDYFFVEPSDPAHFKKEELVFSLGFDFSEWRKNYVLEDGLTIKIENIVCHTDQFRLKLSCIKSEDDIKLMLFSDKNMFDAKENKMLLSQYKHLLINLVNYPHQKINKIETCSAQMVKEMKDNFIRKNYYQDNLFSVTNLFQLNAQKKPEALAVADHKTQLTYKELSEKTNQLAALILQKGVGKNDLVAVLMDRSVDAVISILSVLKAGAAFLPMDVEAPKERIRLILETGNCKLVITQSEYLHLTDRQNNLLIINDRHTESELSRLSKNDLTVAIAGSDLAYVIYTSGSTGVPKGCEIKHESLFNYLSWASDFYFNDSSEGNFPLFTSLGFDLTLTSVFLPLIRGKSVYAYSSEKGIDKTLLEIFRNEELDCVKLTPAHIQVLEHLGIGKTSVKKIIAGGEALTKKHLEIIHAVDSGIIVFNEYGPTEATVGCIVKKVGLGDPTISIGRPIANTEIFIVNNGILCAPGMPGEIYIAGIGLAKGYRDDNKKTADKFIYPGFSEERFYATGDLGFMRSNGEFEYLGRKDDQVKIMSHRVELGEINSVLESHPSVQQAVTTTKDDASGQKIILSYVRQGEAVATAEVKKFLETMLPVYMIPLHIIPVNHIPLTSNGKIDYKQLLQIPVGNSSAQYSAPETETEKLLSSIWSEILDIKSVSRNSGFFELGGTSLKAIRLISMVARKRKVKLDLKTIFANPVLKDQAKIIDISEAFEYKPIPRLSLSEHYELSHSQKRLWVLSQLEEGAVFYNMPRSYSLTGDLDIKALEMAFEALIERHESIRTALEIINGEVRQKVIPAGQTVFKLGLVDLSDTADKENTAKQLSDKEATETFDFSKGMLLRASLLKIEKNRSILLITIHHLVSDGWSMDIVTKEVLTLYNAFRKNLPDPLPQLPVQFKDYAAWHNRLLEEEAPAHKAYWVKKLNGLSELQLPIDKERPKIKTYYGFSISDTLTEETSATLKEVAAQYNTTLFVCVLSVVKLFLHKISGQTDVVIGTPVAGRDHQDVEGLVGFFVNMIASRTIIKSENTFADFLQQVHGETMEDLGHQIYPFDALVEDLKVKRDLSRSAIYNVGFNWDMDERRKFPETGLEIDVFNAEFEKAQADLWFFAREEENRINLSIEYNSDLFNQDTVLIFMEQFKHLFSQCLNDPQLLIKETDLLLPEQKELNKSILKIDLNMFTS